MSDFRRDLGLFDAAVVVAGGIVGVGIFANPSNVARVLGSPALILLAWALGGLVALVGGFVWAELASRFPEVGGQYVYLERAYHPVIGFLYGVALLFIINGGSLAAVSILFASYVDRSFFPLGHAGIRVAGATALVTLTAINAVGVRAGKWTNNVLMAAKVAGIMALIALAFGGGHSPASHFDLTPDAIRQGASLRLILTALVPILFAYGGWQSCANIAGEIKQPARNLPRANVIGVTAVLVLYLSLNLAYLWVLTPQQIAESPALAADMARAVAGAAGARFVALLIVVSSLGFLAVVILTGPRLYYAMALDGIFFPRAARLHPVYRTPVFALWFQAAVSLVLMTTNTYDQLLSYVVFADWLFFGLTAGALLIVRGRGPAKAGHYRVDEAGPAKARHYRHDDTDPAKAGRYRDPRGEAERRDDRSTVVSGFSRTSSEIAYAPGHPLTTIAFIAVAAGVVTNSFVVYPTQSLIGTTILLTATIVYFVAARPHLQRTMPVSAEHPTSTRP